MSDTLTQIQQYAALSAQLAAMLSQNGVEPQHADATLQHVVTAVSGAATVGQVLSTAHSAGGIGLLGAVLIGLQAFAPHLLPSGIQIVPVASPTGPQSVLALPQQ